MLPQEEAYQRMSSLKKAQWEKNNTFYSNRSFSRDIRKVRHMRLRWPTAALPSCAVWLRVRLAAAVALPCHLWGILQLQLGAHILPCGSCCMLC